MGLCQQETFTENGAKMNFAMEPNFASSVLSLASARRVCAGSRSVFQGDFSPFLSGMIDRDLTLRLNRERHVSIQMP
jgi:hypothetical protein